MKKLPKKADNISLAEKTLVEARENFSSFKQNDWGIVNNIMIRLGQLKLVIIITLLTVFLSVLIVYALLNLFADEGFPVAFTLKIAAVTPIFIAPFIAWPLIRSHLKLASIEKSYYVYATYDMLTGVLTRYAFFNNLRLLHELAIRNKLAFSIATIDIDDFKNINDTYGHAAGDEILKSLGGLIKSSVRDSDFSGRVGGDEIVLVLPNTKLKEAEIVAEKIRALVETTVICFDQHQLKFTLSIGVSQSDITQDYLFDEVLESSDKALYLAKKQGKNCVVLSE